VGGKTPTVLIVDDEIEILSILKELLQKRGYRVTTTGRGDKALDLAKRNQYSIILADLKMPGFDGFKLVEALLGFKPNASIIVMSGYGEQASQELERFGIRNYFAKPLDFDSLLRTMNELISL
jgi:DNA-binding NtrC family response regulator